MANELLFKETVEVYGSILGMGTLHVAMCSEEQETAEIWICTKTPRVSPANIHVNQSNCKTALQINGQDKHTHSFLSLSNKALE